MYAEVMILRFILVLIVIGCAFAPKKPSQIIHNFAGPFKIRVKKFESCPSEIAGRNTILSHGIIQHVREFHEVRYNGTIEIKEPLDDKTYMDFTMASWNSVSGWAPNAMTLRLGTVCSTMNTVYRPVRDILETYEVYHKKFECPFGPGNLTLKNMPLTYQIPKFAAFPYGHYRSDAFFRRNGIRMACFRTYFDAVPDVGKST